MADTKSEFDESMAKATTDEEKIKVYYMFGKGTIQDYARIFKLSVDEVNHILDLDDLSEVLTQGDLIDQAEAGPEVRVNPLGNPAKAHYTTD